MKTARLHDNKLQAAGLLAEGFCLLPDQYKIGKLQDCQAEIVTVEWWLLAGCLWLQFGSILEVFWGLWTHFLKALEVFRWVLGTIGLTLGAIGLP